MSSTSLARRRTTSVLVKSAETPPSLVQTHAPVEADHVAARLLHQLKQCGRARAEVYDGDAGRDVAYHFARVRQDVLAVVVGGEGADPRVEKLDGLRAGLDLRVEVSGKRARDARHQRVPRAGVCVHQALGVDVVFGAAALADVGGEREGCAAEADEREVWAQFAPRDADGFVDVIERRHVFDFAHAVYVPRVADGVVDDGAFAVGEFEFEPHRRDDEEDVGEDDGGVNAEAVRGVDRDFGGDIGALAHFEERMLRAHVAVLLHVTPGLPHQPDGRVGHLLAAAGAHEGAIPKFTGHPRGARRLGRFAHRLTI